MNKIEFIIELSDLLEGVNKNDKKEAISFYSELIDDRIEKGMTENEAVASLGEITELVKQIKEDSGEKTYKNIFEEEKIKDFTEKVKTAANKEYSKFEKYSTFEKTVIIIGLLLLASFVFNFIFSGFFSFGILVLVIVGIWYFLDDSKKKEILNLGNGKEDKILKVLYTLFLIGLLIFVITLVVPILTSIAFSIGSSFLVVGTNSLASAAWALISASIFLFILYLIIKTIMFFVSEIKEVKK